MGNKGATTAPKTLTPVVPVGVIDSNGESAEDFLIPAPDDDPLEGDSEGSDNSD